eukprot:tig00000949_g5748.t1
MLFVAPTPLAVRHSTANAMPVTLPSRVARRSAKPQAAGAHVRCEGDAGADAASKSAEKLGVGRVQRHIFICNPTKAKCAPAEVCQESWAALKKLVVEEQIATTVGGCVFRTQANCLQSATPPPTPARPGPPCCSGSRTPAAGPF